MRDPGHLVLFDSRPEEEPRAGPHNPVDAAPGGRDVRQDDLVMVEGTGDEGSDFRLRLTDSDAHDTGALRNQSRE